MATISEYTGFSTSGQSPSPRPQSPPNPLLRPPPVRLTAPHYLRPAAQIPLRAAPALVSLESRPPQRNLIPPPPHSERAVHPTLLARIRRVPVRSRPLNLSSLHFHRHSRCAIFIARKTTHTLPGPAPVSLRHADFPITTRPSAYHISSSATPRFCTLKYVFRRASTEFHHQWCKNNSKIFLHLPA